MRRRGFSAGAAIVSSLMFGSVSSSARSVGVECSPDTIHVDIGLAEDGSFLDMGKCLGQTFYAADTVISRIRVWRLALNQPNVSPMKMWITTVNEYGRPLTDGVIREGPVVQVIYGDGVHHTPIDFDFDPPVVLPIRGRYAFFVQQICTGFFSIMVSLHDVYPDGIAWLTDRSQYAGCFLASGPDGFVDADMIFDVVFCDTKTTDTKRKSWGQVKTIYR